MDRLFSYSITNEACANECGHTSDAFDPADLCGVDHVSRRFRHTLGMAAGSQAILGSESDRRLGNATACDTTHGAGILLVGSVRPAQSDRSIPGATIGAG